MTSPDADEPHAIADTQMFRRFVEEGPQSEAKVRGFSLWTWPGLLVPIISSVVIVALLIILLTG
jgi:hypothetical protein